MTISSRSDLEGMTRVGQLVARARRYMRDAARVGMTTEQLDDLGARFLRRAGARSAPQLAYGFPGFSCISLNDEVVHGVPGPRKLERGDILKIDVTAELDGFIADSAETVLLPPSSDEGRRLRRCAHVAFARAMRVARAGIALSEIGRAVEDEVMRHGFSVIRDLTGHGVGRRIHEEPAVPNYYSPLTRGRLREGQVLAIEPLVSSRPARVVEEPDGWTLRTHNRALAVHHEHTVIVTRGRAVVLTAA
ncbi:MAG TPA: type I methionyl aminopeptidase [Gemmatimonadaceae bacterium]|nr:type I methionyl aminopeptidase [Gemmatimonadaceae bacterium]